MSTNLDPEGIELGEGSNTPRRAHLQHLNRPPASVALSASKYDILYRSTHYVYAHNDMLTAIPLTAAEREALKL